MKHTISITEIGGYYYATDDDTYDGAVDGNNIYGEGDTELESILDLLNKLDDHKEK